ncbi:MAG TPA: TonB-dependent receptor [Caulobacteraceae bacterium]|nr:TonB-dependent receptor [Caulobacteraceae bacterium]
MGGLEQRSLGRRRWLATSAFLLAAGALPTGALAQSAQNDVVIVATPLDATGVALSHVPANAQTLNADDISRQGAANLADLLNGKLGSVSLSDGTGNPYQNDVNYRGFQATSLLGAPVGLAVYFDGVRVNEPFGSVVNWDLIPMNALAGVNVEPGSNPIFGLNALGGALVVKTKTGQDSPGAAVSLLGGSFGRWAASVQAGGADAATHTDYFVAGNDDKQTGYRDHSASEVKQLFGKARWHGPGERTLVELSGAYADTDLHGTQSLPLDMLSTPKAAYTWPDAISNQMWLVNLKAGHWLNDKHQLSGEVYVRQSDARNLNSNAELDDGCFNANGSLAATAGVAKCANQAPGGSAINSITGANALALGFSRYGSSINTSLVQSTIRQQTVGVTGQWRANDDLMGRKNTFILGGAFDQSNITYGQSTYLARLIGYQTVVVPNGEYGFTANGLAPSASNLPAFTGSNVLTSVTLGSRVNELNLYATDTIDLTSRLSVTVLGGYEYTSLDQSGVNNQYLNDDGGYSWTDTVTGLKYYNPSYVTAFKFSNTGTGAVTTPNGVPAGSLPGPEANGLKGSHRYQRFNPGLGFNYNLDPALGLFGAYSESMRAPTSIELSCANPKSPCTLPTGFNGDPDLKAVTARTVELGGRGKLGGGVTWNAAMYDSRLQNDIQFIATSATYGYFFNVGATERRGVEIGAQAELNRLSLSANYGYVEATFQSPFTTAAGQGVKSGNRIPGIPSSTVKLRADYRPIDGLSLGGAVVIVGQQYAHGNESNTDPDGKLAGYAVVDLDAQYRIGKALTLSLNIDNVFDQVYSTYGLSGVTSIYTLANQPFRTPAPPRGVWLKATYAFGGAG